MAIVVICIPVIGFDSRVLRGNHQSGVRLALHIEQAFLPFFRWDSLIRPQPRQVLVGVVHRLPVAHLDHVRFQLLRQLRVLDPVPVHLLEASREFNVLYILLESHTVDLPRLFQKIRFAAFAPWHLFLFLVHVV